MDTRNKKSKSVAIISCLTALTFLISQISYAYPRIGMQIPPQSEAPSFLQISIPDNLASIDDIYEAPVGPNPRIVLHIQNAHANYDAQQKI